uniref:Ovule protein n=1 Tax=Strongyloides venezuelensis TaxID=75913 RepID=A0A0K0F4S3_STRVS
MDWEPAVLLHDLGDRLAFSSSKYGRITQLPNSDESDKLFDVHSQPEVNFKGKISQPLEVESSIEQVESDPDIKIIEVDESTKRIP